nr:hypothetical protein Iba_chr06dCG10070 [Ipomoea batatas]
MGLTRRLEEVDSGIVIHKENAVQGYGISFGLGFLYRYKWYRCYVLLYLLSIAFEYYAVNGGLWWDLQFLGQAFAHLSIILVPGGAPWGLFDVLRRWVGYRAGVRNAEFRPGGGAVRNEVTEMESFNVSTISFFFYVSVDYRGLVLTLGFHMAVFGFPDAFRVGYFPLALIATPFSSASVPGLVRSWDLCSVMWGFYIRSPAFSLPFSPPGFRSRLSSVRRSWGVCFFRLSCFLVGFVSLTLRIRGLGMGVLGIAWRSLLITFLRLFLPLSPLPFALFLFSSRSVLCCPTGWLGRSVESFVLTSRFASLCRSLSPLFFSVSPSFSREADSGLAARRFSFGLWPFGALSS